MNALLLVEVKVFQAKKFFSEIRAKKSRITRTEKLWTNFFMGRKGKFSCFHQIHWREREIRRNFSSLISHHINPKVDTFSYIHAEQHDEGRRWWNIKVKVTRELTEHERWNFWTQIFFLVLILLNFNWNCWDYGLRLNHGFWLKF